MEKYDCLSHGAIFNIDVSCTVFSIGYPYARRSILHTLLPLSYRQDPPPSAALTQCQGFIHL